MNWINNLFYMGLFTALTGSIAFAVYAVVAGVLDGLKKYRYIYGLLLVVLPFWLFPGLFLLLYVTHYRKMGEALFIKEHPVRTDTCDCAHRVCGGVGWWLWRRNGSRASSGSLLPGGTLHKKAPDAGGKRLGPCCGRDKGAFKDPGKCRSVLL